MTIQLYDFEELFEKISAEPLPDSATIECIVSKSRCGHKRKPDYANGLLVVRMESPIGPIEFAIRWNAEGQPIPEHGWAVREAPDFRGAYIKTAIPVLNDSQVLLPDDVELDRIAYDFWPCRDIDELIVPLLPRRQGSLS